MMSRIDQLWKFIQRRDNKKEREGENLSLFHEAINIKDFDTAQFKNWENNSGIPEQLCSMINAEYQLFTKGDSGNKALTFNETPQYSGIHINCRQLKYENVDYKYFQIYLAKKILSSNYKKSLAEAKSERKNNNISTFYNFYLKPNLLRLSDEHLDKQGRMPQLFGNILMKYESINEYPHQLTITINKYSDYKYQEAKTFSEFIKTIFPK